ncbi:hypothetical protein Bca52824_018186 [Brassica carinata]|uniref:Uncharacterized protein n=1 Tax=Brassica carinata TaxID=52824 RepID=A0A8X7VPK7_BRACI|nr:hypothetical protein Bca52824_018186 [Brassica carinata]
MVIFAVSDVLQAERSTVWKSSMTVDFISGDNSMVEWQMQLSEKKREDDTECIEKHPFSEKLFLAATRKFEETLTLTRQTPYLGVPVDKTTRTRFQKATPTRSDSPRNSMKHTHSIFEHMAFLLTLTNYNLLKEKSRSPLGSATCSLSARYRVEMSIADETGEALFVCFDGVMTNLHDMEGL